MHLKTNQNVGFGNMRPSPRLLLITMYDIEISGHEVENREINRKTRDLYKDNKLAETRT